MKKQNVRTLSLIVATITYLLIGAAIFDRFANTNTNTITYLLIGIVAKSVFASGSLFFEAEFS